jgi:hypothetical protein
LHGRDDYRIFSSYFLKDIPAGKENQTMAKFVIALAVGMVLAASAAAHAGKIYGEIRIGDKAIPEGVKVTVSVPAAAPAAEEEASPESSTPALADSTVTDKFGAYALKVKGEGKCTLTVWWEKQTPSLEVVSYSNATRYDLILEKQENKYILKRK